jgi:hypothetical protein
MALMIFAWRSSSMEKFYRAAVGVAAIAEGRAPWRLQVSERSAAEADCGAEQLLQDGAVEALGVDPRRQAVEGRRDRSRLAGVEGAVRGHRRKPRIGIGATPSPGHRPDAEDGGGEEAGATGDGHEGPADEATLVVLAAVVAGASEALTPMPATPGARRR